MNLILRLDPRCRPQGQHKADLDTIDAVCDIMYHLYKSPDFRPTLNEAALKKYPHLEQSLFKDILNIYADVTHRYCAVIYGNGRPVLLCNAYDLKKALFPKIDEGVLSSYLDAVMEITDANLKSMRDIVNKDKDPVIYINPEKLSLREAVFKDMKERFDRAKK